MEARPGKLLDTPGYVSPEQAAGRVDEIGQTSDVYSLGATLYALLVGRAPFNETDIKVLTKKLFMATSRRKLASDGNAPKGVTKATTIWKRPRSATACCCRITGPGSSFPAIGGKAAQKWRQSTALRILHGMRRQVMS